MSTVKVDIGRKGRGMELPRFSELIKSARAKKNLSVRDLEKHVFSITGVRVSRTYISFLEIEKRKPTYEVAFALAEALGLEVDLTLASAFQARREHDFNREVEGLKHFTDKKDPSRYKRVMRYVE